ncbi:MAG: glycerate-2-kinase family protein, partial [Gammaproteobacteria bacterium]|nr:glycerate-2-kinase family protein [Gammaproteobacteria bacterium]
MRPTSIPSITSQCQTILSIYQAALRSVEGEQAVSRYLAQHPLLGEWAVVAVGKAAASMAQGAQHSLGDRIRSGLVITKYGHSDPRLSPPCWRVVESGHPVPDGNSLAAGEALLAFVDTLPDEVPLLFLLSGGASALVEALPEGMTLPELEQLNNWLLGSGLAIGQMNTIRKHLSRLKGGRLARHLRGRRCLQLLISDVPGDDPASIGSAPLYPPEGTTLPPGMPVWLQQLLERSVPLPAVGEPDFARIETHIIASNTLARKAAATAARAMGLGVIDHPGHYQGSAERVAEEFADQMVQGEPGVYLWGGESSVELPPNP